MNNNSTRHHYIPKFLIKGFTDENNELYIFDKQANKILEKKRHPKSIFWEQDRNTMFFKESSSSIIEDVTYSKIDLLGSEAIRPLREIDLSKDEIPLKSIYNLQTFILNLFWRIPSTDELFDIIYEIINSNEPLDIKQNEALKKHKRTYMFIYMLKKEIDELKHNKTKYKFIEFDIDCFILTDNPTLYKNDKVDCFTKIDNYDFIFPLSSKRGFIKVINDNLYAKNEKLYKKHALWYNALAIQQSMRYSVSSNLNVLQESLKIYHYIVDNKLVGKTNELLFKRVMF